jgi:N utilization substance protein B
MSEQITLAFKPTARRKARRLATQALYQQQLAGTEVQQLALDFADQCQVKAADEVYFKRLIEGVLSAQSQLDQQLIPYLDRPIEQLDPVEKAILRLGAFELKHCLDVPLRVVINESIELAKVFGATDSYKYINGVLDKLALQIRQTD